MLPLANRLQTGIARGDAKVLAVLLWLCAASTAVAMVAHGVTGSICPIGVAPLDFDAEAYLRYYPEVAASLQASGALTNAARDSAAKEHYMVRRCQRRLVYKNVSTIITYHAHGGLINQFNSHLPPLALAIKSGSNILIASAIRRSSYGDASAMNSTVSKMQYYQAPFDTLFDFGKLQAFLAGHHVQAHAAPTIDPDTPHTGHFGNYSDFLFQSVGTAFKLDMTQSIGGQLSTPALMTEEEMGPLVWRRVAQLAEQHAQPLPGGKVAFPVVVLYAGLQMNRYLVNGSPLALQIAKHMQFAGRLHTVAGKILAGVQERQHDQASDKPMFNGIHLRVENDASSWWSRWGSVENLWAAYLKKCKEAGLSKQLPLYMASGLLTYCSICREQTALRLAPYCSRLLSKDDFLTRQDLAGLHSEQLAAIDFLVIAQSQLFVGLAKSTFSWHLREYRALHGISSKNKSWLLDAREPSWTQLLNKIATFESW